MSILKRFGIGTDEPSIAVLFTLLSICGFVVYLTSPDPASVQASFEYYDMYATLYPGLPIISFAALVGGLLFESMHTRQTGQTGGSD